MIRIGKAVAGTVSSLALVVGLAGTSFAQSAPDTNKDVPAHPSSDTSKGSTSAQGTTQAAQEKLDKEKGALKDRIQQQVTAADANIDALKKMGDNEKGPAKKRDEDMEKKLSDLRGKLQDDLDKIDKASTSDWKTARKDIEHDVQAMTTSLHNAETVTKVPVPRTGAASKQPPSGGTHESPQPPSGGTHESPQPTPAPQQP
jgi:hypothetical protein